MKNPVQAYRQFSVQGAPPLRLVVMLYDGAIASLRRAVDALAAHDIEAKCAQIKRALAIITQLEGILNFERGGEVALNLKRLYVYARTQIMKANIQNSAESLQSLSEKLAVVREAWSQAERAPEHAPPQPEVKAPQNPPVSQRTSGSWRMSA
jgi:flagellar secretion chaperone FliS